MDIVVFNRYAESGQVLRRDSVNLDRLGHELILPAIAQSAKGKYHFGRFYVMCR